MRFRLWRLKKKLCPVNRRQKKKLFVDPLQRKALCRRPYPGAYRPTHTGSRLLRPAYPIPSPQPTSQRLAARLGVGVWRMRTPSCMPVPYGCIGGMRRRTHIHPHIRLRALACVNNRAETPQSAVLTIGGGQVLRWEVRSSVSVPDFGLGCKLRCCGRAACGACRSACFPHAFGMRRPAGSDLWVVLASIVGSCGRFGVVSISKLPTRNSLNRLNI